VLYWHNKEKRTISDLKSKIVWSISFGGYPGGEDDHAGLVEHPLKGLKAVMLSIDWEITDSTMDSLINEIKNVEFIYSEDKIIPDLSSTSGVHREICESE